MWCQQALTLGSLAAVAFVEHYDHKNTTSEVAPPSSWLFLPVRAVRGNPQHGFCAVQCLKEEE